MATTLNYTLIGRRTRFHMFWQQGMSSPSHLQLLGQAKGIPPSSKIDKYQYSTKLIQRFSYPFVLKGY